MTTRQTPSRLPLPNELDTFSESAWIDVVRSMDEVYNELLQYEVVLEQKNSELEESQQFIFSILTSMSDLLLVCDRNGVIEEVNHALLAFTGKTEQELKGAKLSSLFADENDCATAKSVISSLTTEPANDVELQFRTREGNATPVALNFTPRLSATQKLLGVVITGRPLGELRRAYHKLREAHDQLKRTQQQLLQSEKMASLGKLVAGVAHELNNPISFVLGNMHAMQRYTPRFKRYLDAIHIGAPSEELEKLRAELRIDHILDDLAPLLTGAVEGAERTRDIVDGLKRFSAADRDENIEFNLAETIERTVHWVTRAAPTNFRVVIDVPKEMPFYGSPGQIQQVITNLVQNASDATESLPDPMLTITARMDGEGICILFRDNGPGISDQAMGKIFDPFYTTKPVGKGTGLGLSISYGIIERHGGLLSVSNAADGGAEFKLCLPHSNRK
ncbi:ATP-binding protein [Sideroxydans sp. CL21]|uniref:ATP-binding protein n=1 Tax=Sideroxydans sp. CL21 TaxID=2600596 RepID=UPI0012A7DCFD|nr:ATP-binding protein [Sideroxydans sp. CL21]VVC82697.1 Signal transduction histidine kinase HoxJ (hydrogenase regulation) [Sideroxydans sp. CL21]